MKNLLQELKDVVNDVPGCARDLVYSIKLKENVKPVRLPAYRMAPGQRDKLKVELDKLLEDGFIEPSESLWSSPCILVPKPRGAVRCCVDFRGVNKCIIDESFPIAHIEEQIEKVGNSRYITKFDMCKGCHQIPLDVNSKKLTSFSTSYEQFQFTVLPFGLKTSPTSFSLRVNKVLEGLENICGICTDDIVIYSDSLNDHIKHLKSALNRFRNAGFTIKLLNCEFCKPDIEYVEHMIGYGRIKVDRVYSTTLGRMSPK